MQRKEKGFTLLELIIVVIVIGILASIALPRYLKVAEKARVAEAKAILGALRSAQMRYSAQYGAFAIAAANLDINMQTARYFNAPTFPSPAEAVGTETSVVAIVTRNGIDNPTGANCVYNITQAGVIQNLTAACGAYL